MTYTLPEQCRNVARSNQRTVYDAFFRASAKTFMALAAEPKHLGGLVGMMGVLQTWRRDIGYHVHIHYVVPGGALSPERTTWLRHRYDRWLVPEKALAARFKERFRAELDKSGLLDQVDPTVWERSKKWVVDCEPVGTGEQSLRYLAPYVHRVAITNNRIERVDDNAMVTFGWKHRSSGQQRHMTLSAERFLARFLQHVLPKRFMKVRYYGFLSPRKRKDALPLIGSLVTPSTGLLSSLPPAPPQPPGPDLPRAQRCPVCARAMVMVQRIPRPPRRPPQREPP